ncbi:MAG: DUF1501 domain-containing protein [Myxococcales bacterium]|nr:DUF1501 domain-containing protein [Myxococcales bacterium]
MGLEAAGKQGRDRDDAPAGPGSSGPRPGSSTRIEERPVIRRRALLGGAAALASAALVGAPRRARAAWGTWPEEHGDLAIPPERQAGRVLELYMYGGLCPWDTFYCGPGWGEGEGRYLHAFGEAALAERWGACGPGGALSRPFAEDGAGAAIDLGPWTWPLWQRPDVLARTRVIVTRHDQFPHSTAVPLCLTGARLGRPGLAGGGAMIGRHFAELGGGGPRAMVVHPGDIARLDNVQSALAVGPHPSASRPLEVALSRLPHLLGLLDRPATADARAAHDAALSALGARMEARLRRPDGVALAAPELDAWAAVDAVRRDADALAGLFAPELLGLGVGEACGESDLSITGIGARVAAHALAGPEALRYALWVDAGLRPTLDGGHDTHRDHLVSAPRNYAHTLATLVGRINAPGEADPNKLDLDDAMIAITSEFGRTPAREDEREGLGHWPAAGVTVLIGGPIDRPAIAGAVDRASGAASAWASPAEVRMAILLALGIFPFDRDGFVASEAQGGDSVRGALLRLRALLGVG